MEEFDKGAKRKCTSCSTLFLILKIPNYLSEPGATVSTLLTNVQKRKTSKVIKNRIYLEKKENELL